MPVGGMAGLPLLKEPRGVLARVELRILEKFHQIWVRDGLEPSLLFPRRCHFPLPSLSSFSLTLRETKKYIEINKERERGRQRWQQSS